MAKIKAKKKTPKVSKYHKHHTVGSCIKHHPYISTISVILLIIFLATIYYTLQVQFAVLGLGV